RIGFFPDRGRSTWPESSAIGRKSRCRTIRVRQRSHSKVCRSLEKTRREVRRLGGNDFAASQEGRSGNAAALVRGRTNLQGQAIRLLLNAPGTIAHRQGTRNRRRVRGGMGTGRVSRGRKLLFQTERSQTVAR